MLIVEVGTEGNNAKWLIGWIWYLKLNSSTRYLEQKKYTLTRELDHNQITGGMNVWIIFLSVHLLNYNYYVIINLPAIHNLIKA